MGDTVLEDRTDRRRYRVCIAELAEENRSAWPTNRGGYL
jgi:hypothetical protein